MPMSDDLIFEARDLSVALDSTIVLEAVDFRLAAGEFLVVFGANGSGKTTLVRALLGLERTRRGSIAIFGGPAREFGRWSRIGYVPQRVTAVAGAPASVREVVLSGRVGSARWLRPYGDADRRAAVRALEAVGMTDLAGAPVAHLSGGQQQRVLIARALAADPDVLVLDEPVSGVDLEHQERLAVALRDFHERGGSVLLVAHALGAMEDLITREVVMDGGRVTYDGPHLPHHVHTELAHHPEDPERSPLDRVAGGE
jgi:zinc transport system ATP-binding protein